MHRPAITVEYDAMGLSTTKETLPCLACERTIPTTYTCLYQLHAQFTHTL